MERNIAKYAYKHKNANKWSIAQSDDELDRFNMSMDFRRRLGKSSVTRTKVRGKFLKDDSKRMNAFWAGAKGYQKIGFIKCIGIPGSGIFNTMRNFLTCIWNHGCMIGDRELMLAAREADTWYHENGNIHNLFLMQNNPKYA